MKLMGPKKVGGVVGNYCEIERIGVRTLRTNMYRTGWLWLVGDLLRIF